MTQGTAGSAAPSFSSSERYRRGAQWRALRRRASASGGAIMVEYLVVVGFVALVSISAFVVAGTALVSSFDTMRGMVLCPLP